MYPGFEFEDGFQLEEWCVEPKLCRMVRDQVVVRLRPRVMEALTVLARRPGEVVSKRDLVDAVWSSGFVADNTIVHCIRELRDVLGDDPTAPRFVQTIPRRGYRMLARAAEIDHRERLLQLDSARFQLVGTRWTGMLLDGSNLIGRGGDSCIVIRSDRISRHHARIVIESDEATVEDLGSKNGTLVGGRRVEGQSIVRDGDTLVFADHALVLRRCASAGESSTVPL